MINKIDNNNVSTLMQAEQDVLYAHISERSEQLAQLALELKTELFGIDEVIERVIESMRAWYVLPELINRPVIICLWGLTGTGKTQLTRSIAQKLGFYDRFVEVQMDGFSNGSGYRSSTISDMLSDSGIKEGDPGVLVLDEFQRFRTVSVKGEDIKVVRYQDVWTLLSDGRLAPALSFMSDIEYSLADSHYDQEREKNDDSENGKALYTFKLKPYEAQQIKRCLKLKESLTDIMGWTPEEIQTRLNAFRKQASAWETDYSKLLIFVSGNLDEMYEDMAKTVQDCDTDADIFHELTKKLSIIDVKKALSERFKPEQIARLGNNHVIYPSFSRATYQKLIDNTCNIYVRDIARTSQLQFEIDSQVRAEIYSNAVFPSQGTRPLFSSIHSILSAPLVNATLWAIEHGATALDRPVVSLDQVKKHLLVHFRGYTTSYPVRFELNQLKQRTDCDFRALLAVHEAGHGLLYGLLFRQPPQELKINTASFEGGYASFIKMRVMTRQNCLDRICVGLGGRVAEAMVFGDDACTTGAQNDYKKATALAALFVRQYGFGERMSLTDITPNSDYNINTEIEPTNTAIEGLLVEQYARATELLKTHSTTFMRITQELVEYGEVPKQKFADWLGIEVIAEHSLLEPYANRLKAFDEQIKLMGKLVEMRPNLEANTLVSLTG
jgi:Peptidase family M41/ATPase family associated with various cellular activities (AAA)